MPPLWCRLDRLWFGHPGVLPGTLTRQPFICPLDHVFEVLLVISLQFYAVILYFLREENSIEMLLEECLIFFLGGNKEIVRFNYTHLQMQYNTVL